MRYCVCGHPALKHSDTSGGEGYGDGCTVEIGRSRESGRYGEVMTCRCTLTYLEVSRA